jgi:hypothetical protein
MNCVAAFAIRGHWMVRHKEGTKFVSPSKSLPQVRARRHYRMRPACCMSRYLPTHNCFLYLRRRHISEGAWMYFTVKRLEWQVSLNATIILGLHLKVTVMSRITFLRLLYETVGSASNNTVFGKRVFYTRSEVFTTVRAMLPL